MKHKIIDKKGVFFMGKIKLSMIVLLVIVISFSFTVLGAAKTDIEELNLKTAVSMALKQNLDLKKASLNLEKSKLEYQKNKANNLLKQSRYNELQAEYQLKSAESNYRNTTYNVVNSTIRQYTDIWLARLDLKIQKKKVELQKQLLAEAKAQYEIGDIGTIDLLEQENSYKDAEFNLETAGDDYQQSMRKFKSNLGLGDSELVLNNIGQPEIWKINEKEALKMALENSIDLKLRTEDLELARLDLERTKVSSPELDIKIKKIALEISLVDKENTLEDIVNSTRETYFQYKQGIKNLELQKERLNEAREKYQLKKEQYEAGLITKTDVLQYETNMIQSESQYKSAISSYYLNEQSLRQAMNLETGVHMNDIVEKK